MQRALPQQVSPCKPCADVHMNLPEKGNLWGWWSIPMCMRCLGCDVFWTFGSPSSVSQCFQQLEPGWRQQGANVLHVSFDWRCDHASCASQILPIRYFLIPPHREAFTSQIYCLSLLHQVKVLFLTGAASCVRFRIVVEIFLCVCFNTSLSLQDILWCIVMHFTTRTVTLLLLCLFDLSERYLRLCTLNVTRRCLTIFKAANIKLNHQQTKTRETYFSSFFSLVSHFYWINVRILKPLFLNITTKLNPVIWTDSSWLKCLIFYLKDIASLRPANKRFLINSTFWKWFKPVCCGIPRNWLSHVKGDHQSKV